MIQDYISFMSKRVHRSAHNITHTAKLVWLKSWILIRCGDVLRHLLGASNHVALLLFISQAFLVVGFVHTLLPVFSHKSPAFLHHQPFLLETYSSASCSTRVLLSQAYGTYSLFSFFYLCPHYSLKISPKKRRRFSKSFRPLSHVSTAFFFLFLTPARKIQRLLWGTVAQHGGWL